MPMLFGEAEKIAVALPRNMTMDSRSISQRRSLGSCRCPAAMRPTLLKKGSVWPANTRARKGHILYIIVVRNDHILRTLPPLCVSSSLDGMDGVSDQIAGSKRVNAGGIHDQTSFAGEREKGDTVWSLAIFWRQISRPQNWWEACSVENSINYITQGMMIWAVANTTAAAQWMHTEFFY